MRHTFGSVRGKNAQTLVFFILSFGAIVMLCGLAIDSGLLYLAKARLGRAVDGAALAAVGNFHRSDVAVTNRDLVATIMRNFAEANYTDLKLVSPTISTPGGTQVGSTNTYTYNFNDNTQDANGQFKRFIEVTLTTGAGGGITSAVCNARCPVKTYFIGFAGGFFRDLKVSQSAEATRNPRLIMVVVDRSGSMLAGGGGAYGLPQSIVQFLDFFDTSSDYIGIVSFGTNARLEMPLTTNFIYAGTNVLFNTYQIDTSQTPNQGIPGPDPEQFTTNADYDSGYNTTGVRRMKFGGTTAADEGFRLGMEQLMTNGGFNDPDVVKYLVLFTDGAWNNSRTLLAAPGYTNTVTFDTNVFLTPYSIATNATGSATATGNPGPWSTTMVNNTNLLPVPTLSPMPLVTNAIQGGTVGFANLYVNHTNDTWLSSDGVHEPLGIHLANNGGYLTAPIATNTCLGTNSAGVYSYTHNLDVWLQPGSVDYVYRSGGGNPETYVSNYNNATNHIAVNLNQGDSNVLVVPGYVTDGMAYDQLDLAFPDTYPSTYQRFRDDNFLQGCMWPDDGGTPANSLMRQLMFRNYVNLLTGFYVARPDQPLSTQTEPLFDTSPPTQRSLYGLGPYYPGAGFYWPFDQVGVEVGANFALTNATYDPDPIGKLYGRHLSYSINMLSPAAAPAWTGEWFYKGSAGTGSLTGTGNTPISSLMATKGDWTAGAPSWLTTAFDNTTDMTNEAAHNGNLAASVWRPLTYNGSNGFPITLASCTPTDVQNKTGGYVTDGAGHYYRNTMAWSGRPTHYFDFSKGTWLPIPDNHTTASLFLPIGNWKVQEYAWHARAMGVTIFTVGYGQKVNADQQVVLALVANSTNTTGGNPQSTSPYSYTPGPGTAISFNPSQPIGQQFYATTTNDIITDFSNVATAINAALTQ